MNANISAQQAPAISSRFVDNGDGTVTDNTLRLMWSKETNSSRNVNHEKATQICAELALAGHTDWRLPTREELLSIVDLTKHDPAVDKERFPDTQSAPYWTSTLCAWASSYAWIVNFYYGYASYYHRGDGYALVRAVRSLPAGQ